MQVGVGGEVAEALAQRLPHPVFVDPAHVVDVQLILLEQPLLVRVDAADAELPEHAPADGRRVAAEVGQDRRAVPAEHPDGHAVDVAAR